MEKPYVVLFLFMVPFVLLWLQCILENTVMGEHVTGRYVT